MSDKIEYGIPRCPDCGNGLRHWPDQCPRKQPTTPLLPDDYMAKPRVKKETDDA